MIGHEPVDEAVRRRLHSNAGERAVEKVGIVCDLLLEAFVPEGFEHGDCVICRSSVGLRRE